MIDVEEILIQVQALLVLIVHHLVDLAVEEAPVVVQVLIGNNK
jgi:hypothetical protein